MKTILLLLFFLPALIINAQNFEGTITWKMSSEITDPKIKAQMAEAKKKMEDPATQAQMKQMQEKMNDPEFKKLMDANPQMKAQMEAAIKMTQGGTDLSALMPKGMTMKMKNENVLTHVEGGPAATTETLYLKGKQETYMINREAKTYSKHTVKEPETVKLDDAKVTKTSETQKILNYTCTKYIVELKEHEHEMQQIIWATTEIKDIDFHSMANQQMNGRGNRSLYLKKIDGVPLKVEMKMPQGQMIMEVTEIRKQSLPASDFTVPSDFKETKAAF